MPPQGEVVDVTPERFEQDRILARLDMPVIDRLWVSAVVAGVVLGAVLFRQIQWIPGSLPVVFAAGGLAYAWLRHGLAGAARGERSWLGLVIIGADILFVVAAIYVSGGCSSPYWAMFVLPVLAATVRFGLRTGLAATGVASVLSFVALVAGSTSRGLPGGSAGGLSGHDLARLVFTVAVSLLASFFLGMLVEEERKLRQEILTLSRTDPLTGIYNHRYLSEVLRSELKKAARRGGTLAVSMIDLDLFKSVNDTFGHLAGDRILAQLVNTLKGTFRATDCLARYGGDEIAVVIPGAGPHEALTALERAREAAENARFAGPNGRSLQVTISAGVAIFPDHGDDVLTLLDKADRAMYAAKNCGGNRVQLYHQSLDEATKDAAPAVDSHFPSLSPAREDFGST